MRKIAGFICARPRAIILVVVILNLVALASFLRFDIDTAFLSFFSGGNPRAQQYQDLSSKYSLGETVSVMIEADDSLLTKDNLREVFTLQEDISAIDGVSRVQSFLPPQVFLNGQVLPVDEEFLNTNSIWLADFIQNEYFLKDQFLTGDSRKAMIIVSLDTGNEASDAIAVLEDRDAGERHLALTLAGDPIIKDTLSSYLSRIIFILMPCAVLLILAVFFLSIRSFRLTVLAWLPAAFAALWTFGTMFWSGQELNLVTVISPLFVIVIGSAFGLHYVTHFMESYHKYDDGRQRTVETLAMVGAPILLAALTTMAGFASLVLSDVTPMRQMGIFVTAGIAYAAFVALFFLPAVLSRNRLAPRPNKEKEISLNPLVSLYRRRVPVFLAFAGIAAASIFFIPRLEVVSDQLMFFKDGSEIRNSFDKVEEYFGGASPLVGEIALQGGYSALRDQDFAARTLAIEREMEELPGIKSVMSIFDLGKGINRTVTGQDAYPEDPAILQGLLMQLGPELSTWVSGDGARLLIRTADFDSRYIAGLEQYVDSHDQVRAVAGMPLLFDEMNRLVVRSQIQSLGLALFLIFLMLLITLREFRAALVGMIPISITILAILGLISATNFNLNVMTANLSAISIGVGVDYAIHVLMGIRYFGRQGMSRQQSIHSALSSVSRPVLANAFGLAIGLSVLFFSPLRIHFQAASVMWVAMIVSSMAALLLIPALYSGGKESGPIENKAGSGQAL